MKLSAPQYDIMTSTSAVNLFLAGQGSGKTHTAGILSAYLATKFPTVRGLIAANTHDQLNRATMFRIREVWKEELNITEYSERNPFGQYVIGRQPPAHFNVSTHNFERYHNIISFVNGHVMYVGSLENYKALDGMEVAYEILDETKDTRKEAVEEVLLGRLRQSGMFIANGQHVTAEEAYLGSLEARSWNPLFVFTSPAKVQWLNDFFGITEREAEIMPKIMSPDSYYRSEHDDTLVTISSSYHNAHNLPDNYIDNMIGRLPSHLVEMLVFGSPFSKSGGEMYKYFDRKVHVGQVEYDPELPIWMSWDENVNPYLTCSIWQFDNGRTKKDALKIDEICLESPRNTVDAVCREFARRYQGHEEGVFITGDATSRKQDTKLEKGFNFFKLIQTHPEMKQFNPILKVPVKNPPVVPRVNFMNTIFEKNFGGIHILISEKCQKTIADFTYLKEDSDGTKKKEKERDSQTGVSYEKYGHITDADDYAILKVYDKEFKQYLRGEDGFDKDETQSNRPTMRKRSSGRSKGY